MPQALRWAGASAALLAAAWVGGADGIDLRPWAAALTVVVVAVSLLVRLRRGGVPLDTPRVLLGVLVAWAALLSALQPVAPADAAAVVAVGAVAWGLTLLVGDWRARAWATGVVAALGACSGMVLVAGRWAEGVRSDGLLGNPNLSATVALLGLAAAPFVRLPLAARGALGVTALAGIVASGSRAAVLGTVAVTLAWLIAGRPRRWLRLAALGVLLAGLGALVARVATDRDPLRFERVRIWGVALRVARDHLPWGTGPGGFADAALARNFPRVEGLARYGRTPDVAESDALQLCATTGVPGTLLAAWLVLSLLGRLRGAGPQAWGCAAALGVTSSVHTQLPVPVVAWTAALAVAASLGRSRRVRVRGRAGVPVACAATGAAVLGAALLRPPWWLGGSPTELVAAARGMATTVQADPRLADAEALAARAVELRPRWAEGWRALGAIRASRAWLRGEARLWAAACDALQQARTVNPHDALAAFEEGRCRKALGARERARAAWRVAVESEPNLGGAWLELALLDLEEGRLEAARAAFFRGERALSMRVERPSTYEQALRSFDPATLARLRAALGESP